MCDLGSFPGGHLRWANHPKCRNQVYSRSQTSLMWHLPMLTVRKDLFLSRFPKHLKTQITAGVPSSPSLFVGACKRAWARREVPAWSDAAGGVVTRAGNTGAEISGSIVPNQLGWRYRNTSSQVVVKAEEARLQSVIWNCFFSKLCWYFFMKKAGKFLQRGAAFPPILLGADPVRCTRSWLK